LRTPNAPSHALQSVALFCSRADPRASTTGCCPRFDPTTVTQDEIVWKSKLFVAEHVRSLFYVPLNMTRKVKHGMALIHAAGAQPEGRPLMLGEELSPFRSNIYLEVTHYVPEANMIALSGTFLAKAFEGPFRNAPRWIAEMERLVSARGQKVLRLLFGYTTCPSCARAYGENYVVLYAQVAGAPTTPASAPPV
jgi:hypothetical protein